MCQCCAHAVVARNRSPCAKAYFFHRESNPACPSTRQTLEGLTATTSASSIMNVSRR